MPIFDPAIFSRKSRSTGKKATGKLLQSLAEAGLALERCMDMDKDCCNASQLGLRGPATEDEDAVVDKTTAFNADDERIIAGISMFLFQLIRRHNNPHLCLVQGI